MEKTYRVRTAELVVKVINRMCGIWIQNEKQRGPLTGAPELQEWIADLQKGVRSVREPDAETIAIRSWLKMSWNAVALWQCAEDVLRGSRPETDFGKAVHVDGALQRIVYATLRSVLAAKIDAQKIPVAIDKIAKSKESVTEIISQYDARVKKTPETTVTYEVAIRLIPIFDVLTEALTKATSV